MSNHCPDHTPSGWSVEENHGGKGTLAIVTYWDGMGVLELGLGPGGEGYGAMCSAAQELCEAHNADLRLGVIPRGEEESIGEGFAEDLSGEEWQLLVLPAGAGGPAVRIGSYAAGFVAIIGTPERPADTRTIAAAANLVILHNELLGTRP